jgi:hypothetical protein
MDTGIHNQRYRPLWPTLIYYTLYRYKKQDRIDDGIQGWKSTAQLRLAGITECGSRTGYVWPWCQTSAPSCTQKKEEGGITWTGERVEVWSLECCCCNCWLWLDAVRIYIGGGEQVQHSIGKILAPARVLASTGLVDFARRVQCRFNRLSWLVYEGGQAPDWLILPGASSVVLIDSPDWSTKGGGGGELSAVKAERVAGGRGGG